MSLYKRLGLALLLTAVHLGVLNGTASFTGIPLSITTPFRIVAMLAAGPAMVVRGVVDVRSGQVLQLWPLLLLTHLFTPWFIQKCRDLYRVLRSPEVPSRRALFLGAGVVALSTVEVADGVHDLQVNPQGFTLKDLPPPLKGLRIALPADLHRGPAVGSEYLERVIATVNRLEPDVVLLPGDFVSKSKSYYPSLSTIVSRLRPNIGSFATLGNHDNWEGPKEAVAALEAAGIHVLQNRSLFIDLERRVVGRTEKGLCLAGIDDLRTGRPDIGRALARVPSSIPVVLLSHNPDFAELHADCGHRIDLQVSGHTHAGQVVIPGLGPVATASA